MQLGMSIANGEMEFCGNAIKQKLKVLYVDTEIGMDEFHRRYLRIKKYLNWTGDDNFLMISKSGEHADIWDDVHEVINYNNPDLLIIDSLYNSTTVDDFSKSAKMSRVTDAMTEFKDKYGISVLGVHHFNKGQHDQGLMIDRMQGSAVLQNWVEFLMIMISTNVDDFNLWTVGKTRGTFHDKSIIGLKWNDFWFKTVGIVEDYKPFLITEHKKKKWMTVLEDCPNQFSTSDWLNVFNSLFKLSERTGRTWLSECSNTPMVKRLGQGLYQKKLKLISEENEL